jgi:hypothetical protein
MSLKIKISKVIFTNFSPSQKYKTRNVVNRSHSDAKYKLVATVSPFFVEGSSLSDYDYVVMLLQTLDAINEFSDTLYDKPTSEFLVGIFSLLFL